ncbi:hypothetical protein [Rhodohalobacter sulfatireducens]|uniref:DUF5004 domain-containing protein n=1 Tax=Rhodohalobacter sulfatireducens TaxID=2911366 RepID=A0ABS9KIC5_9BACT|nr:hypothetical protein [Rhodohalobacter sulfatireducens]MCG2590606.1 hypothetical protein [Rhodohalobacter sulfatireducens]MDR9364941.1 hypothetical protein [Balneolaceae bacterium]MDR9408235.1 hypothetical protein [Balneolaceae bacterium]
MNSVRKILLSFCLLCIVLFSCTDDSLNQSKYEPKEPDINLSGLWLLSGAEETTTYSEWPIPPDEDPVQKKNSQGFNMLIQQMDENKIRIYGLVGADAGRAENSVFSACSNPENCKVYGTKTGDRTWEVDIKNGQRTFYATIEVEILINKTEIRLESRYEFQNKSIEHTLDGEKIPE